MTYLTWHITCRVPTDVSHMAHHLQGGWVVGWVGVTYLTWHITRRVPTDTEKQGKQGKEGKQGKCGNLKI